MRSTIDQLKPLLDSVLGTDGRVLHFDRDTPLLGQIPELDSMAVATLITAISDHFDITVEDHEMDAELFATLGHLADFVDAKRRG